MPLVRKRAKPVQSAAQGSLQATRSFGVRRWLSKAVSSRSPLGYRQQTAAC